MYLVPVLVAVEASNATSARLAAEAEFRDRAAHVGGARFLSPIAVALAEFDLRVYANNIELEPAS